MRRDTPRRPNQPPTHPRQILTTVPPFHNRIRAAGVGWWPAVALKYSFSERPNGIYFVKSANRIGNSCSHTRMAFTFAGRCNLRSDRWTAAAPKQAGSNSQSGLTIVQNSETLCIEDPVAREEHMEFLWVE